MDLWVSFWSGLASFTAEHGLLTVAIIVLLKSAGVPVPLPADLLVVLVGVHARETQMPVWPAWVVLSAATTIGAGLLYTFATWVDEASVVHYGHYVGLTPARLQSAEDRLQARGARAILSARLVPGLRLAIVAVSGIVRVRWHVFLAAVVLGALVYDGACLAVGYLVGAEAVGFFSQLVFPLGALEPLICLMILGVWLARARRGVSAVREQSSLARGQRIRAGALAGALSVSGAIMVGNLLLYVGGPIAATLMSSTSEMEEIVAFSSVLNSVVRLVSTVLVGTIFGCVYAAAEMRWVTTWPEWLRGIAFAAVPFGVLAVAQVIVLFGRGQPTSAWLISAIGECLRWATYGLLLGWIYPVWRARRALHASREVKCAYSCA